MTQAMKTSISEVLEKMFFLPLDFSDAASPADLWDAGGEPLIAVRLEFEGPISGRFALLIPRKLGSEMCADFMGCAPDEVSTDHVEQTAKEIINMVAGSTFSALDEEAVFNLGIPEAVSVETVLNVPADSGESVFLGIDTLESHIGLLMLNA
jgi:chemotaxis protein CheY-P-specific phosphatase CheC